MARKNSVFSAWVCGVIVTVCASVSLISSTAQAQTGWGESDSPAALAGKKVPPPPPPPPLQVAGSWVGTIQDSNQGLGTIGLIFTQKKGSKTKSILKGSWTNGFLNGTDGAINDVGTLTGSVTATAVALTLSPRRGDALGNCKLIFNSIEATLAKITGTYRFSGCSGSNTGTINLVPGPQQTTTVFVNIADDFFFPSKLSISAGQTVRWTNNGGEQHAVNSNPGSENCKPTSGEAFASPTINTGEIFEHTFNSPGTFAYHCEIHGCPMRGTITVQ